MISNVSHSTPAANQADSAPSQNPAATETPFRDVLASQITGIDLEAWLAGSNSGVSSPANTPSTAATAGTPGPVESDQVARASIGTVMPARTADSTPTSSDTPSASSASTPAATPSPNSVPTVQSVFGSGPWISDPTGSGDGETWNYNPIYFATEQTAETVAQMMGGTVVETNAITGAAASPLQQNQPNFMVDLSSGAEVNPGLVADMYNHGYSQGSIDQELTAIEQQGVSAS